MSLKPIQQSIRMSMRLINKAMKQVPSDKRSMLMSRVNNVLHKYSQTNQEEESLKKFQKQLEFNINFIKLSHPNLDYTLDPQTETPKEQGKAQQGQNKQEKQFQHKFKLVDELGIEYQRLNTKDILDQQEERERKAREQVEFSNWFEGNADPQQLKRHKELLQRQHFKGEYWKDKPKPESFAKEYLMSAIAEKAQGGLKEQPKKDQILEDFAPRKIQTSDESWQKVKR